MAPREGLELALMKMVRVGPALEPCCRPQAGKSGDPRSQNADRDLEETGMFQGVNPRRSQPKGKITLPMRFGGELNHKNRCCCI